MNKPSGSIKLLFGNPNTSEKVSRLPDDTEAEILDSHQCKKWRCHGLFQYPMVSVENDNGEEVNYWVGDAVEVESNLFILSPFFALNNSTLMAEAFSITKKKDDIFWIHAREGSQRINAADITGVYSNNVHEELKLELPLYCYQNFNHYLQDEAVRNKFSNANPLKRAMPAV